MIVSTYAEESVAGLVFLSGIKGIVDETEASALSTTELGAETEDEHLDGVDLVDLKELCVRSQHKP